MKRVFFVLCVLVATSFAIPVHAKWEAEVGSNQAGSEVYIMRTDKATCRIIHHGDLMVEVVTISGERHRGYYNASGSVSLEKPAVEGEPLKTFRLVGCNESVSEIPSQAVRCLLMDATTPYGPKDYDRFGCIKQRE